MLKSCDTMVALGSATRSGEVLFAKNSDRSANECQPLVQHPRQQHALDGSVQCQYVALPQAPVTYRHVGSRPYWCWGYEHGFNEHQVVIGNEGLRSKLSYTEPKLVGMEVLRLGLERGRTAAEAVEVMTTLISRHGQGVFANGPAAGSYDNGYLVADPREAYMIETAGHEWAVQRVKQSVGISNVYSLGTDWDWLSPNSETYAREQGWWQPERGRLDFAGTYCPENRPGQSSSGARRRARSCALLAQQTGTIDVPVLIAVLSDHSTGERPDEPLQTDFREHDGICVHCQDPAGEQGGNTAASLVADLCADGSRLPVYWCSLYSPCLSVFFPVFSEGTLPPVLAVGDSTFSAQSPWWLFHRLACLVRACPEERVGTVRQEWSALQQSLFERTYPLAVEGKRLLDNGQTEAASRLLTDFMEASVAEMLTRLNRLLRQFD